jgi:S-DNA-T family DNA segregation ATPase FtsK/SpoIIIE
LGKEVYMVMRMIKNLSIIMIAFLVLSGCNNDKIEETEFIQLKELAETNEIEDDIFTLSEEDIEIVELTEIAEMIEANELEELEETSELLEIEESVELLEIEDSVELENNSIIEPQTTEQAVDNLNEVAEAVNIIDIIEISELEELLSLDELSTILELDELLELESLLNQIEELNQLEEIENLN